MTFDLVLPDELANELDEAARDCRCTVLEFACGAVESVLASRGLPRMWTRGPAHGAFTSGCRKAVEEHVELEPYQFHCQITEGEL